MYYWMVKGPTQDAVPVSDANPLPVSIAGGITLEGDISASTEYDRDTASTATDKLGMAGVVRADAAASLVGTDGDRTSPIVDALGRLWVNAGALPADPFGANADAAAAAGAAGSVSAKLRTVTAQLNTLAGHLDGVEGLLGTLAGAVAGTEVQADVLTLPADPLGANADAAVAAGAAGSLSAKLRRLTADLDAAMTSLAVLDDWDNADACKVGGFISTPSANFNRPADTTAYASGDLVANSTTAGSVVPLSWTLARVAAGSGMVRKARLKKSGTSVTNASFRLHLYSASPTVTNGDNGAWLSTHAGYLGSLDFTVDKAFSDAAAGNGAPVTGSEVNFSLASGQTVYGLIEARGAYVPASGETFTVELECLQN